MTQRPNYRATNRGVQIAAAVVAASATLALFAALRPGELPERTLRWAGVQLPLAVAELAVNAQPLQPRVVATGPAVSARH